MSSIQFPPDTTIISSIDLIPNSLNQVAILDTTYNSGVSLYIANNSSFTTALVTIQVLPNVNTNVNYNTLYSETFFLDPQQVLILSNIFNPQNTIINVTIDNTNNSRAYLVYNAEFSYLQVNSINTLPINALVNEQISNSTAPSGDSGNYQVLQNYVTTQINDLTTDVSDLSAIIINNFEKLLDAEDFQGEVLELSSSFQELSANLTSEILSLSSQIEDALPTINTFIDTIVPDISTKFDLLSNTVLANYQTFTTEINNINEELNTYSGNTSTSIAILQQETSNLSSQIDNLSESITNSNNSSTTNYNTLQSEISNITNELNNAISDIDSISSEINTINTNINDLNSQTQSNDQTLQSDINTALQEISLLQDDVTTLSHDVNNISSEINTISTSVDALSNQIQTNDQTLQSDINTALQEISLLQDDVTTLFQNIDIADNEINTGTTNISVLSSQVKNISSDIGIISGSLTNGTISPVFNSIQRQIHRVSQNWLPNSTFLYGLLMWNNSTPASPTTDTKMTSLTYQSTDTSLQSIQSDPITAQWINGTQQIFTISAQISALVTSSTPTINVLCYDSNNNLLGSAAIIDATIGTDYTSYSATSTLLKGTMSVVIELSFSGDANTSYVGFSEIKFEFNDMATQWSDESSSLIINKLYSSVFGASSQVQVNR
jgi:predicted  nucleic acid-binding Zn-ribbon protein